MGFPTPRPKPRLLYDCTSSRSGVIEVHSIVRNDGGRSYVGNGVSRKEKNARSLPILQRLLQKYLATSALLAVFGILIKAAMGGPWSRKWPWLLPGAVGALLLLVLHLAWSSAVVEERVVIMASLGVQFETRHRRPVEQVTRVFYPMEALRAALINEAVTPLTCYFYLALLAPGHGRLLLPFPELRPPLAMLVPIRNAIQAAIDAHNTRVAEAAPSAHFSATTSGDGQPIDSGIERYRSFRDHLFIQA
eukprot:jgi/Mesen1/6725/ME000344S06005